MSISSIAVAGWIGGMLALAPLAFVWRGRPMVVILATLGWPALALGIATGIVRLNGGVGEG